MRQALYGDVLFFINFSMDFLTFFLTAHLLHRPIRIGRTVAASALGAAYAVAILFFPLRTIPGLLLHLAVSAGLCALAQKPTDFLEWLRGTLLFYGVGFLLGGSMTALYSLCNSYLYSRRVPDEDGFAALQEELPFGIFLLLAALGAGAVWLFGRLFARFGKIRSKRVYLALGEKACTFRALCDSGNLLTEPLGGLPVILCRREVGDRILPAEAAAFFQKGENASLAALPASLARRIRMIPVKGVGGGKKLLYGLLPDTVEVGHTPYRACIAFASDGEAFDGCEGLLPCSLC